MAGRMSGWIWIGIAAAMLSGCGPEGEPVKSLSVATSQPAFPAGTEMSAKAVGALGAFNRGAALLEQYEFVRAAAEFEGALAAMPDWTAARFNLGLAYLNLQENQAAQESIEKAKAAFEAVLAERPGHLRASYCLGLLYQHVGDNARAAECFAQVHAADATDPFVAYKYAESLLALEKKDEGTTLLEAIVAREPGFVSAVYRLAQQYQRAGQRDKAKELFTRFNALKSTELTSGTFTVDRPYGSAGKYYMALGADALPIPAERTMGTRIVFSPEVRRFGDPITRRICPGGSVDVAGLAAGDVDGDGDLDVCISGMGKDGLTGLWINDGKGNFAAGALLEEQGIGPCFGDVDNDGDLDLWLGEIGGEGFFENDGKGKLSRVTGEWAGGETITSAPLLADIDSDGDLDLLAMRMKEGSVPAGANAAATASRIWINNRDGSYAEMADKLGLALESEVVTAVSFDDFDNDRDLDLVLFFADGEATAWVNDRGWAFHTLGRELIGIAAGRVAGVTTGDPDKDGDRDLLVFGDTEVALYLNQGGFKFARDEEFARKFGRLGGTGGQFADLDNDGDLDIVIGDAYWKDRKRGPAFLINNWPEKGFTDVVSSDVENLLGAIRFAGNAACTTADFTGDGKCDILLAPTGEAPMLLVNQTAGGHWIAIDLMGMREQDKKSRSNHSAIGARVEVKTGAVYQQFTVGGMTGAATTGPLRIHAGLGTNTKVDWLRIIWPDGVLQAELEVPGDQILSLRELQRKTSSCPHLFAWDGRRYAFVADFGGMGGLGYLAEPGVYARPDSTEYLRIPKLAEREGQYVLQILEPLEEVVYVDEIQLIAVDHPAGTEVYPNEMMAIGIEPPAFELFCYREPVRPKRVTDHRGIDVTTALLAEDRDCAGATKIDPRFVGYAEEHFLDLDFGKSLGALAGQRAILFLQGWLEYPYSATAFAAWQAKTPLRAPTIEVWRDEKWVPLFREVGYPAGLQHTMTVDLTDKLSVGDERLRISTNMELYWDSIFIAAALEGTEISTKMVGVENADLHYFGYPREYSPDGRLPNLYDYENVETALPWKLMSGDYTRFGEVTGLLDRSDDRFVIMGRGEELTLRFSASAFGVVAAGKQRTFILKTDSYCKDMDLYTAHPDTVEPLPFHGMSGYPYGADERYPDDQEHQEYRQRFNTRRINAEP